MRSAKVADPDGNLIEIASDSSAPGLVHDPAEKHLRFVPTDRAERHDSLVIVPLVRRGTARSSSPLGGRH